MKLNQVKPVNVIKPRKRLGRGVGSGKGKTAGRGHKGQNSRAGSKVQPGFEGGQTPLYRRIPKYGFKGLMKYKTHKIPWLQVFNINSSTSQCGLSVVRSWVATNRHRKFKIFGGK